LGDQIFDIEIDNLGNIYYFSYQKKCVFKLSSSNREETVLEKMETMNPASEQIGKNILCSNDRNFVFLRKGFQKITMLNAELAQASPTAKVDKSLFMMHIKINGKIVQMMNLYNRLAVITSSGVLWILNQNLWDKK